MPSTFPHAPRQNRILAALPTAEYERLDGNLEQVDLALGQVLYAAGGTPEFVYFPTTSIVSLIFATADGSTAELAMTGSDGLVGIPLVLGGTSTTHQMVVQCAGQAYRLRAEQMTRELAECRHLQRLCLHYAQALMTQMAQSVVCNRHHTVEQQLCRWLLVSFDQQPENLLNMTQELIANMLGVRREAVTEAAVKLQAAGLIQYRRGHISITDRPGLEARACECYRVVRSEYTRLFSLLPTGEDGRAEATSSVPGQSALPEPDKLLRQLQAHQLELEKQNRDLQTACAEAEALRSRYADIYDFAPVGHFTLDPTGGIRELNLAGAILLGIKRSEKKRQHFPAHVKPAYQPAFSQFVEEVLSTNQKKTCETVLVKTAQRPETKVRIEAVPDENGRECRIVVIDQSLESIAEKHLRKRERYQRTLLDNSPFMAWLTDEQGRFLAVNTPFAANFGWPSTETLLGKTMLEVAPGEWAEPAWRDDRLAGKRGKRIDAVAPLESGGKKLWFDTSKSAITLDDKRRATVGFARDITEHQDRLLAAQASEMRCRSLIDKLPLSVVIAQDGVVQYVNAQGAELLGYSAEASVGLPFRQFVHQADHASLNAALVPQDGDKKSAMEYPIRVVTRQGKTIDCQLKASQIEWEGRLAVLGVIENVTQRKALETELRSQATADSLTELANRRYFLLRQEEALSRLKRGIDHAIGVLMLDLDHFTEINDRFGQEAGAAVLRSFSKLLGGELRQVDLAGRLGGEEFAILLPEADLAAAATFAERLRQKVAKTSIMVDQRRIPLTVSIGIAVMQADDTRPNQVLQRADEALHRAKTLGRNRIELSKTQAAVDDELPTELSDDQFHQWAEDPVHGAARKIYQARRYRLERRHYPAP
ncbi:diguanylate cyclase [Dechloromonas denitrificans]|uniref:diguanylate cyclase n=1 Tax=Dechloromonas denitrificans TaxID=281362 RepID=UPI001CF7F9D0|nr:diguanylate cyclase [Dechloromonas denitrificans]UCV04617.1 diguanylate cyclase [Dechloromonas denitrificans]